MEQSLIDPWAEIERNRGYSAAFISQAKLTKARAVAAEMRKLGLAKYRGWGMPEWAREIAKDVSDRRGVCVSEMAGDTRFQRIGLARNELVYLVKARKPTLSSVQLGHWFNRDHASILHSIACHQERHSAPKLVGYDLDKVRNRNRTWQAKARQGTVR